jgi:hypothetical protein
MGHARKIRTRAPEDDANDRLTRMLIDAVPDPAVALELLYWSREPGLIDVIRGIAMMPEETRAKLETFIALARDTATVTGNLDLTGTLTLSSTEATRTVALANHVAETETDETPRLLN